MSTTLRDDRVDGHRQRLAAALRQQSLHDLLVVFARAESQTGARLRASDDGAAEADALVTAYAQVLDQLPGLLAEREGEPLSAGAVWALADTLDRLRHIAATSTRPDDWRNVALPTPSTIELRDAILAAEAAQTVREQPFVSHAPLVGPLLVRLRQAWNWMSTTWYVRPLTTQQNQFNAQMTALLRQALTELEAARWERDLARLDLDMLRRDLDERERAIQARQSEAETAILRAAHQSNDLLRGVARVERPTRPRRDELPAVHVGSPRLRLAFFSPLSPLTTGVSAYSEALLPVLAEQAAIDIYIGDFTPTAPAVTALPVFSYRDYPARRRGYDATIYQMGNNPAHAFIYETLQQYPGVVVVHDLFIHHFLGEMTLGRGQPDRYLWEMGYAAGPDGLRLARDVVTGARPAPAYDYPLIEGVLDHSLGALCHSQYVAGKLAALRPALPVASVGLATQVYAQHQAVPGAPLTVITATFLTPEKGLQAALEGFARFRQTHPTARYVLLGARADWFDLPALIAQYGLQEAVEVRGYAPTLQGFDQTLAQADIALNLRYPTGGETSASLLRALGVGLPAVVTDVGWFSEVPDAVCLKIAAPPTSEAVAAALTTLADDAARRERMGQAAARWVAEQHSPQVTAAGYLDFITSLL
ncbi:MAG: glycosyltransferase [Anaerolineae bacterium]|nr:glycosyltransferase [Anaerolineae bacterium]